MHIHTGCISLTFSFLSLIGTFILDLLLSICRSILDLQITDLDNSTSPSDYPPPSPEKEPEEYLAEEIVCDLCSEVFSKGTTASRFVGHIASRHLDLFLEGIRLLKPNTVLNAPPVPECTNCPKHNCGIRTRKDLRKLPKKKTISESASKYFTQVEEEPFPEEEEEEETEVIMVEPEEPLIITKRKRKCNQCRFSTETLSNLNRHKETKHEDENVCKICVKTFDCIQTRIFHELQVHDSPVCRTCGKRSKDRNTLKAHKKKFQKIY